MRYYGKIFRPPSEARSLIIQATFGCSNNTCTFCTMYKEKEFTIRPLTEVIEDLEMAQKSYPGVGRIFLADGDALALPQDYLETVLKKIAELFPKCERVSVYATAKNVMHKSPEQLSQLQELGLNMAYLGLESGSEKILKLVKKKISTEEMVQACQKLREAQIKSSVTVISGLGGKAMWQEHARETGAVLSRMDPDYLGLLTLMVDPEGELYQQIQRGEIELLEPHEVARETKMLLEHLEVSNCVFRSNHASNYLDLRGTLPHDKQKLMDQIDRVLTGEGIYKPEWLRGL
ncbi:radical SAM superfamily enzyme YgiQ (UPF0313 family) [Desulfitispora alkaliphila]|uniref:radical SAM protein n=1 Tax=Desulfitispora alkaliphila TaxID=622674 RepID=UPI003D1E2330